jgi:hypothetical protein
MSPTNVQLSRLYDQYGGLIYRDLLRRSEDEGVAAELLPAVFARAVHDWDRWAGGGNRLLWLADLAVTECGRRALSPGTEFDSEQWLLERSVAGDLSKSEHRLLRARLDVEAPLSERLEALRTLDREFDNRFAWAEVEGKVQDIVASRRASSAAGGEARDVGEQRYWRAMWIGGLCALVATLSVMVIDPEGEPSIFAEAPQSSSGPVTLWPQQKAAPLGQSGLLQAFVFEQGRAQLLGPGASVAAGTRLQFRVASEQMYLALLGVDSSGTIKTYVPARGSVSLPWTPGPPQPLGTALELSATPGSEVFLAFMSAEPLSVASLTAALKSRVVAKDDFLPVLLALGEDSAGLAPEVGIVHLVKP